MEIKKDKLMKILSGAAVIAALGAYLFLCRPLISKLKIQRLKCVTIESEAAQAQEAAAALKKRVKRVIMNEAGVSAAVDELTSLANLEGVNFISLTPKPIKEKEGFYKVMPIEMDVGAAYEDLGRFLGSLDKLGKSLTTVDSFSVAAEKERPFNLKTKLVINMYIVSGENAE